LVSALVFTQPVAGLQLSFVQDLLSLQLRAVPGVQVPFWHLSPAVQAEPSLQGRVLSARCLQPPVGSQLSAVQGFVSAQLSAVPAVQVVPLHVSEPLHKLPSEQPVPGVTAVCVHAPEAQASCVHGLVSAQLLHAPPALPHWLASGELTHVVPFQHPLQQTDA
jgi:hypothetical protein